MVLQDVQVAKQLFKVKHPNVSPPIAVNRILPCTVPPCTVLDLPFALLDFEK